MPHLFDLNSSSAVSLLDMKRTHTQSRKYVNYFPVLLGQTGWARDENFSLREGFLTNGRKHASSYVTLTSHHFSHENDLNLMIAMIAIWIEWELYYFFCERISVSKRRGESWSCNCELFNWPSRLCHKNRYSCLILSLDTIIYESENSVKIIILYRSCRRH